MKKHPILVAAAWFLVAASGAIAAAEPTLPDAKITFNRHIAPLVFERCAGCHHPGEVAPFSLLTYRDVQKRAQQIVQVTRDRYMPPWKSVEGHGRFLDERRLARDEIELLARWVEQGAVEGEASDLPPTPKFADGWKLGEPDIVVTMPAAYEIPAEGADVYRNFVLPLSVPPGKYIKALEYLPGNRRIVHHAVFSFDVTPGARKADEADPAAGYPGSLNIPGRMFPGSMAAWAPGRDATPLPGGVSMPWPATADLVLQLHLHPSGKVESEQSSIGFYLTDEPPARSMVDVVMIDRGIDIPPGEREFRTRDEFTVPVEMNAFSVFPHMHLIGRDFKLTAHPPAGEPFRLIWIDDWDFNWQSFYQYAEPVKLPAGTKVVLEGIHDNSADNPRNPNQPPQRVVGGEQTTNEMSAALIQLVPANESELPQMIAANKRKIIGGITAAASGAKLPEREAAAPKRK
jgi:mono/diheme cytochrome c family protein